jgi:transcriptional regulator with XRE-family HTH domain
MIYDRIRALREDKDLTQSFFAKLLNVNQRTYSRYETGELEISLSALCSLADFHEVSVDFLLNRTDEKKPYPTSKKK